MKVLKFYAIAIAVFIASLLLADLPALAQTLKGNGNMKTENRNVSGFSGLDVSGGFAVEITQGNNEGVRLEAEENLLDNIKTEVKNGVLHIYNDKSLNSSKGMKAYVTMRELNSVDISGGVKVTSNSTFRPKAFKLDMSGGTSVKLALNTKSIDADMSGASKIELSGRADELDIDMSGASDVNAQNLEANRVRVEASGASKVKVFAKEALDINASGASAIQYKGSPSITSDVSGGTRISKL